RDSEDGQDCPSYSGPELTTFLEVIGFSRARAESALAAVTQCWDALESTSKVHLGVSPHAPYTVSPSLLRELIGLAQQRDAPVAMHVAESADELELLASGTGPLRQLLEERSMWDAAAIPRGSRPLDYLQMLAESPRALVIHGNYLDHEERSFLGAHADRMSLVYCPRTHAYFAHPPYALNELLAAGVRVALGTDSRASNPDLDLLAEMRFVAATYPAIDPNEVLRMGTLAGAEALGRAVEVGSITPGKLANLLAIPLPEAAGGAPTDLLATMLAGGDRPCAVWIRGERHGAG
ncbi:MAG: amidohydrolase family protein, partial [Pirellulales bacterium]